MYYSIFRNNELVVNVKPEDSSTLSQKKQQEDILRINFTLVVFKEINVGDYIIFEKTGKKYFINKKPRVVESPKNYKYECIFEGSIHELSKTKIFLTTQKTTGFYRDYKFPLTGNAETFLLFIVENLNRNGGSYTAGSFKTTETTTIDFNNFNALQAISTISTELNFDWYLDGNTLNFDKNTVDAAYIFTVGRKVGFTELTRARVESQNIETVVYGYGSTQNLPPRIAESGQTYDSPLLTENRLAFVGENVESKLSKNTSYFGIIESVQEFDDIKPEYTGVVTAIDSENTRIFFDSNIDFDINEQLLSGILPKITFLTGKLIGLTFNISYVDSNNKVIMDIYTDESGAYPNDLIYADVGDQYKVYDIMMPDIYIENAALRLQEATQAYLDNQSKSLESYSGNVDREFIQSNNIVLNLGDIIRIISNTFGIDNSYEIKELTQKITDPNDYKITFGDTLPIGLIASLKIANFNTEQSIYKVQKTSVTNNQVTNIVGENTEWEQL